MAILKVGTTVDGKAVVVTDDPRLSDNRDPNAHNHTLADVTDSGTMAPQNATAVAITGGDVAVDSVQLKGGAGDQGKLTWNIDEETLDLSLNGAVVHVGQEILIHVRNNTAGIISSGTPVMATGTIGSSGRITIGAMDGSNSAFVRYYLGITAEDIGIGADGKVSTFGKIHLLDTSGTPYGEIWAEGDVLWVDTTTPGALTNVEPTSGLSLPIAFIILAHASAGTIFSRTLNIDDNAYASAAQGLLADSALQDADIGVAIEAFDAAIQSHITQTTGNPHNLSPADIGASPTGHQHTLADVTDSGTAAPLDVAAAGDAAVGEVVKGNDSRLTDARTPTAHNHDLVYEPIDAAIQTHITQTTGNPHNLDAVDVGAAPTSHTHTLADVTDSGTAAPLNVAAAGDAAIGEVVKGNDSRLTDSRDPNSHSHTLADVTDSGTAAPLNVAAVGDAAIGEVVKGDDTRLTDARTPTAHNHDGDYDALGAAAAVQGNLNTHEALTNNPHAVSLAQVGGAAAVHTHSLADITDEGTAAGYNVPAVGDAAVGEVVKGDDTRLTDNRDPNTHTHSLAQITDNGAMAAVNDAPSDSKQYARINATWAEIASGGSMSISATAPGAPEAGDMWWNSSDGVGQGYIYFDDGNTSQWVAINSGMAGATGDQGIQGIQGIQGDQGIQGIQGAIDATPVIAKATSFTVAEVDGFGVMYNITGASVVVTIPASMTQAFRFSVMANATTTFAITGPATLTAPFEKLAAPYGVDALVGFVVRVVDDVVAYGDLANA